ncbi:MAG: 5-oxoprolinase subunit B family protein [Polyangiales bacterium]
MRRVAPFGETAIEVSARDAHDAQALARALAGLPEVLEVVVGWDRVLCHLREGVAPSEVLPTIERVDDLRSPTEIASRIHAVRAVYDGPDLRELAEACALSPEEVATRHAREYEVEVIGFLPGFAYLGTVDPTIARPRRATPRTRVPPLSIGIAGPRTAIYPSASPGGWNLVGRAIDCVPFDPARGSLFAVGDRVRFVVEEVACPR